MSATEPVLFDGQLGTQRVRVWLEAGSGGIVMCSHDIGPGLERCFGKDDIETYLEVERPQLPALLSALRADRTDAIEPLDALDLLAERYRGDSAATGAFRHWLEEHGIPHRFTLV